MFTRPPVPLFSEKSTTPRKSRSRINENLKNRNVVLGADLQASQRISRARFLPGDHSSRRPRSPKIGSKTSRGKDGWEEGSIEDILNRRAISLQSTLQKQVDESENKHLEALAQVTAELETKLKLETSRIKRINRPIYEEQVRIKRTVPRKVRDPVTGKLAQQATYVYGDFKLGDWMVEFKARVSTTEKEMERLAQEWMDIQTQIIGLVVELVEEPQEGFGDEQLRSLLLKDDKNSPMVKNMEMALQRRQAREGRNMELDKKITEMEDDIRTNMVETRRTNRDMHRQYTMDMQGCLKQLDGFMTTL